MWKQVPCLHICTGYLCLDPCHWEQVSCLPILMYCALGRWDMYTVSPIPLYLMAYIYDKSVSVPLVGGSRYHVSPFVYHTYTLYPNFVTGSKYPVLSFSSYFPCQALDMRAQVLCCAICIIYLCYTHCKTLSTWKTGTLSHHSHYIFHVRPLAHGDKYSAGTRFARGHGPLAHPFFKMTH